MLAPLSCNLLLLELFRVVELGFDHALQSPANLRLCSRLCNGLTFPLYSLIYSAASPRDANRTHGDF